ncbi:MAG: hypothetical protein AAF721_14395 [Myxococcota bacterium]
MRRISPWLVVLTACTPPADAPPKPAVQVLSAEQSEEAPDPARPLAPVEPSAVAAAERSPKASPRPRIEGHDDCRKDVAACVRKAVALTRTDLARAALLFEVACQEGDAAGCGNWAVMLRDGRTIAQDKERAAELMAEACRKGHEQSCDNARALRGGE